MTQLHLWHKCWRHTCQILPIRRRSLSRARPKKSKAGCTRHHFTRSRPLDLGTAVVIGLPPMVPKRRAHGASAQTTMTTIILRSPTSTCTSISSGGPQVKVHVERSCSSPVHHETPAEEAEDTSKTDQKQPDELSANRTSSTAECERERRLGAVPLSVVSVSVRKLQARRNRQAKHDNVCYWRDNDMQAAARKYGSSNLDEMGVDNDGAAGKPLKVADADDAMPSTTRRSPAKDVTCSNSSEPPIPNLTQEMVISAQLLLLQTKAEVLDALWSSQGDTTNPRFLAALKSLAALYRGMRDQPGAEQDDLSSNFEGTWRTVSKPNFQDGLGQNRRGEFVYTLGRMSFGMFRPTDLRCSIQRILNTTTFVGPDDELPDSVPKSLRQEIQELRETMRNSGTVDIATGGEGSILRTYDIEVEFSIEPIEDDGSIVASFGQQLSTTTLASNASSHGGRDSYPAPSKPLRAKMITQGYLLPDPEDKDRHTVWFVGGSIQPVRGTGEEEAEKSRRKAAKKRKKKAKKSGEAEEENTEPTLSSIEERLCQECDKACPLLLHECRRENRSCHLHGQKKLSKEYRYKMKARAQKYVRPKSHGIYVPHKTGLSVGDMVDAPFDSEWEEIFARDETWKKSWSESAKLLAAKMLLGAEIPDSMDADGSMSYTLHRPIGGHGTSYVDVLYLDENLRITRGNAGSIFVQVREDITNP